MVIKVRITVTLESSDWKTRDRLVRADNVPFLSLDSGNTDIVQSVKIRQAMYLFLCIFMYICCIPARVHN